MVKSIGTQKFSIVKLSSWKDFIDIPDRCGLMFWRGQRNIRYPLIPSIYRDAYYANLGEDETKTLKLFYSQATGLKEVDSLPELVFDSEFQLFSAEAVKWWALAQHYGLPTPFLDWTQYPYVALFFAINNITTNIWENKKSINCRDETSVAIWGIQSPLVQDECSETCLFEDTKNNSGDSLVFLIQNIQTSKRIRAQGGIFTYLKTDKLASNKSKDLYDITNFISKDTLDGYYYPILIKCEISFNSYQEVLACRRFLAQCGISMKTMFPDLEGVVQDSIFRLLNNSFSYSPLGFTFCDFNRFIANAVGYSKNSEK